MGGVVKVEIYEVDMKIALYVDTFWIVFRSTLYNCFMSTENVFMSTLSIVNVDIKIQVIFCRPNARFSIST